MTEERKALLKARLALKYETKLRRMCEQTAADLLEVVEAAYELLATTREKPPQDQENYDDVVEQLRNARRLESLWP